MHLIYKKGNGCEYASACSSRRDGGRVLKEGYVYLGKVIDKGAGIYESRDRGLFTYDPETGEYGRPDMSMVPKAPREGRERLILDFGDAYLVGRFMEESGIAGVIEEVGCSSPDTFKALVMFMILSDMTACHAEQWHEGSYARVMYPRADLKSQRISDFMASIGDEYAYRNLFEAYLPLVAREGDADVAIDGTGVPNSIHFPLTAVRNHGGEVRSEVRLIFVVRLGDSMPIYFRYVPGNVLDASTLARTLAELRRMGVHAKFAVVDAGYCDMGNMLELYGAGVSFLTRLRTSLSLYREAEERLLPGLEAPGNLVRHGDRFLYVSRERREIVGGHTGYVYLVRDMERRAEEDKRSMERAAKGRITQEEMLGEMRTNGLFAMASSRPIAPESLLASYYARQGIEQFIDVGKNYTGMKRLGVHSEETFRGLMALGFLAAATVQAMMNATKARRKGEKGRGMGIKSMLLDLRNQKCKVFDDAVLPDERQKRANDAYEAFGYKYPLEIPIKPG